MIIINTAFCWPTTEAEHAKGDRDCADGGGKEHVGCLAIRGFDGATAGPAGTDRFGLRLWRADNGGGPRIGRHALCRRQMAQTICGGPTDRSSRHATFWETAHLH